MSASLKEDGWMAWMDDRHEEAAWPDGIISRLWIGDSIIVRPHLVHVANPDYKPPRPYWKAPNRWEET